MLIHTGSTKIKELVKVDQDDIYKPNGIWYATNKEWINFSKNWASDTHKYIYIYDQVEIYDIW